MSEVDDLSAAYRTLSTQGLERLRATYTERGDTTDGWLHQYYIRRLELVVAEMSRRTEDQE